MSSAAERSAEANLLVAGVRRAVLEAEDDGYVVYGVKVDRPESTGKPRRLTLRVLDGSLPLVCETMLNIETQAMLFGLGPKTAAAVAAHLAACDDPRCQRIMTLAEVL